MEKFITTFTDIYTFVFILFPPLALLTLMVGLHVLQWSLSAVFIMMFIELIAIMIMMRQGVIGVMDLEVADQGHSA